MKKQIFTQKDNGLRLLYTNVLNRKHGFSVWMPLSGFTMAEILLSLTIIGVVAAITLPSLTGNINERTWNTQRKALYARFSQAIALMPALNGYGNIVEVDDGTGTMVVTEDNVAETFITSGLAKVLKINNICNSTNLGDCGVVSQYTNIIGSKDDMPTDLHTLNGIFDARWREMNAAGSLVGPVKTNHFANAKAAAFETANGESILTFYNKGCKPDLKNEGGLQDYTANKICANFIYDLNGKKGPNTVGKDMGFITVVYPSDSVVVAPIPYKSDGVTTYHQPDVSEVCQKYEDARVPNLEEFMALTVNKNFSGAGNGHFWTSKLVTSSTAKVVHTDLGRVYTWNRTTKTAGVQCIKR